MKEMLQEEPMRDIDIRILKGVLNEQFTPQEREDRRKLLGPVDLNYKTTNTEQPKKYIKR